MQTQPSVVRIILQYGIGLAVFGGFWFAMAGTLVWPAAWLFLLGQFAYAVVLVRWMVRSAPERLAKRKEPFSAGQPLWDRVILWLALFAFLPYFVLPGLDAVRFGWSQVPWWLQALGFAGVAAAEWLYFLVLRENPYLSRAVQPQEAQTIITTGPYAVVRHPMYAAICLLMPSLPLMLGSAWAVLPSVPVIALAATRIVREEQFLQQNVPGYAEYAQQVRWRLVPGVW
ncbi:MAG: isoprenylcysteine carboxylmethyltransferase family protein [Chloroflexi bacterium]|nr:isoprenylcysteine carboxylmethyltransferase family protein [Chloroflexota bacterium]